MHRNAVALLAALLAALVVVSFSAAASQTPKPHGYHRIISLSPTVTEDLFKIGAGKQVVAVDQDSNYPASAPTTNLSGYSPDPEAVASYHPDLVLISYDPGNFASQMEQLGIKVVMEPAAANLSQVYKQIKSIGKLTGHVGAATSLVSSMQMRMFHILASVPRSHRHFSVYHEIDSTYYSATSNTFIGSIYKLFGFSNIADAAGASAGTDYPQLGDEYIVSANPQIVVLADGQDPASVGGRDGGAWSGIGAVVHHRVVAVDEDIASRWGPRIVEFAAAVAKIARKN